MYVEDKRLIDAFVSSNMLSDGEQIEKSCTEENKRFVVFTNKRILSGHWYDRLPRISHIPYSAIIFWETYANEDGIGIKLYLPDEHDEGYFFETNLGGEIISILTSHVLI